MVVFRSCKVVVVRELSGSKIRRKFGRAVASTSRSMSNGSAFNRPRILKLEEGVQYNSNWNLTRPNTTMSLIRSSRLVTTSAIRTRPFSTQFRRYADEPAPKSSTSDAPNAPASEKADMISQEGPGAAMARHAPNYNVAVDYRTSYVERRYTTKGYR